MRTFVFRPWKAGCRKPGKANGIAKYLENHGIHKIARQNDKNPLFDAALIRRIIQNPVYSGKISYGRRRTEKVHGTRNEYRQVKKDDYLLVDGLHEALVSEEVWEQAQVKVAALAGSISFGGGDSFFKVHRETVPSIGSQREGLFFNPLTNQLGKIFRFVRRNFENFL